MVILLKKIQNFLIGILLGAGAILPGVSSGVLCVIFGLYDKLIKFAGAGAQLPIMSFGHSVIHGAMEKSEQLGFIGIGMGMFDLTAAGITAAILFAFIVALIFKPKG